MDTDEAKTLLDAQFFLLYVLLLLVRVQRVPANLAKTGQSLERRADRHDFRLQCGGNDGTAAILRLYP